MWGACVAAVICCSARLNPLADDACELQAGAGAETMFAAGFETPWQLRPVPRRAAGRGKKIS